MTDDDPPASGSTAVPAAPPAGVAAARRGSGGFFRELPFLVVVAFGFALLIKTFLVQAFFIPSGSMEQTLAVRDRVLVNKVIYDLRDIRRGEIVVFNGEGSFGDNEQTVLEPATNPAARAVQAVGRVLGVGPPSQQDFIKRVIGLPGDRVACCDEQGRVTVQPEGGDPVPLDESTYLFEDDERPFCEQGLDDACRPGSLGVLVPDGQLWVLGDHRGRSSDSRAHLGEAGRGMVPQDRVIGQAAVVVWPLGRATALGAPEALQAGALGAGAGHGAGAGAGAGAGDGAGTHLLAASPYALGLVAAVPLAALRRRWRRARG